MNFKEHLSFFEFLNEETIKNLNLDDDKSGKTLGQIDLDDSESKKAINRIKSVLHDEVIKTLAKSHTEKNNLDITKNQGKQVEASLRNLFSKFLLHSEKEGYLDEFSDLLNNPFDVSSYFNGKVLGINEISKNFSNFLVPSFWEALLSEKTSGNPAIGPGEILLAIFTNLSFAKGNGDLEFNGNPIEVKGDGGSLRAGTGKPPDNMLKDIFQSLILAFEHNKTPLNDSEKSSIDISKATSLTQNLSLNILELLKNAYNETKSDQFLKEITQAFPNYKGYPIPNNASEKLKEILTSIKGQAKIKSTEHHMFEHWILLLDLYAYSKVEGFNQFIQTSYSAKSKPDMNKSFLFITIDNNFKTLFDSTWEKIIMSGKKAKGGAYTEVQAKVQNW